MRRIRRFVFRCILVVIFISLLPSIIGILFASLLLLAFVDFTARRHRNTVRTLNSAIRAVCQHDGAITKVAAAFARTGSLRDQCSQYARRLSAGEDPIDAAVASKVPLQLRTAIALQNPSQGRDQDGAELQSDRARDQISELNELAMVNSATMPAYGQLIYLTVTALTTCVVLSVTGLLVVPSLRQMHEEFHGAQIPNEHLLSMTPVWGIIGLLFIVLVIIIPVLNRGHLFGIRLPRWLPTMPRLAERKADMLNGLADGMDAGWPISRTLTLGHAISIRSFERNALARAATWISQGNDPIESIRRAGLIETGDEGWLTDASPSRTAQLLRVIASQGVRDANANIRWVMTLFFPLLILMLGGAVMAYAFGFFSTLTELIHGLA